MPGDLQYGVGNGATLGERRLPAPTAAYIHIPFCAHKCGYCDFASVAGQEPLMARYLDALEREMAAQLPGPLQVSTIFVGGGTPTYLPTSLLEKLFVRLNYWFPGHPSREFTVESNPNTLDEEKVRVLAEQGVNRVSLGAQSFQPALLARLERNHDPQSVPRAVEMVRQRIDNISLDLIFGVMGSTLREWTDDLARAMKLEPTHLSTYGLTYEKGTPLHRQKELGIIHSVDEEVEREMFEVTIDRLSEAGYIHYEISNFAKQMSTGEVRSCRHNMIYWANDRYYGFGTGAAAYIHGTRSLNTRELTSYIARCEEGRSPRTQSETLEPIARARETAMLNLRRLESGLARDDFVRRTGFEVDELFGHAIARWARHGLLTDDGQRVRLTREGIFVADAVLASMLD